MTEIEIVDKFNNDSMRAFAICAAGILLNLGLFFILVLIAPLLVGIVCGYILGSKRNGILTGFLSAVFSYSLIFVGTGFATDIPVFGTAVLIMSLIGAAGGFIGALLQKMMIDLSSQVSTTIRPGE
ncbi:hypothetical protein EU528_03860 [Candidatus Thorarchaeota archaeon]|nr:MAG: hypothetical protein EU528_03860 [Candidatus Thorarchaeota archaeon]